MPCILRGEGASFCSGLDLSDLEPWAPAALPASTMSSAASSAFRCRLSRLSTAQALTGGLVLALFCDLRIADNATLGMTPGPHRLICRPTDFPQTYRDGRARQRRRDSLSGRSRSIRARAREMGLVHKVVPDAKLAAAATAWADEDRRQRAALYARDEARRSLG